MTRKNKTLLFALLVAVMLILTACAGEAGPQGEAGPAGPQGEAGPAGADAVFSASDLGCVDCHNDTTLIAGKEAQYEESFHANGEAFARGTSASCAGCHSGGGFSDMIAAGLTWDTNEVGDPNPTRQDCRTCHAIHTTYTGEDWALETTAPVAYAAVEGVTFDGGTGNLCATCHQPRTSAPVADADGNFEVTSTHWGPHHGPQSTTLLGVNGGGMEGSPSPHMKVENTCVTCHMGEGANHTWEVQDAVCAECHGEDFDYTEAQAEVQVLFEELGAKLEAAGAITDGHQNTGVYTIDVANALWNYLSVMEDKSMGAHNAGYITDLLEYSIGLLP
jgi:hypothetical protein